MPSSTTKLGPPIAALLIANGFQMFADQIPNGHSVPNPNPQGGVWAGVGHFKAGGGGGALNPFGVDFAQNGFAWTEELCQTDSDGDGRSNGQELGDPDCLWTAPDEDDSMNGGSGLVEVLLPSLSHPGIVDQVQDQPATSSCVADDAEEENELILEYDMKFSAPVAVSAERTTYMCELMQVPVPQLSHSHANHQEDTSNNNNTITPTTLLHKVKSSVLIDNRDILHHIFVYFCFDGRASDDGMVDQGPYRCDGAESVCTTVAGWAIGPEDECLPPNIGTEFDFTGLDSVVVKVEAHYDNALGIPQQDASGMRVSFTPQLRPLKSGSTAWGMDVINKDFIIPPNQERHSLQSICPSEATALLEHPIYVFRFNPHMHTHGVAMKTEHYRCGQKLGTFGHVEPYEFDNQQQYSITPAVKILPGDALVTTCEYNTVGSNETLYSGLGTDDEMCVSFMTFYPRIESSMPGFLQGCFSFENGISLDRVGPGVAGPPDGGDISGVDPSAMAQLLNGRFALISSTPLDGLLFDFSSDPTQSWAPCCDTNTCDVDFLASENEPCAVDVDCAGDGVVCRGGLCAATSMSDDNETTEGEPAESGSGGNMWSWHAWVGWQMAISFVLGVAGVYLVH